MYKEVADAEELEQLDDLMHGQSHRAELSAKVQSFGGQTYSNTTKKNDNYLKLSHTKSLKSTQASGRGGGVIGTRGRASQSNIPRQVDEALPENPFANNAYQKYITPICCNVGPSCSSRHSPQKPLGSGS